MCSNPLWYHLHQHFAKTKCSVASRFLIYHHHQATSPVCSNTSKCVWHNVYLMLLRSQIIYSGWSRILSVPCKKATGEKWYVPGTRLSVGVKYATIPAPNSPLLLTPRLTGQDIVTILCTRKSVAFGWLFVKKVVVRGPPWHWTTNRRQLFVRDRGRTKFAEK